MKGALAIGAAMGVLFGALLCPWPAFCSGAGEKTRAIVDSGHAGAVRWIEVDEKRGLLFSAGDDGTVRIWDPVAGNLLHTLHVTQLSTGRIAVNPFAPQLAVVVTDGNVTFLAEGGPELRPVFSAGNVRAFRGILMAGPEDPPLGGWQPGVVPP